MGMRTHIFGSKDQNCVDYKNKFAAYKALKAANIKIPQELIEYFANHESNIDEAIYSCDETCEKSSYVYEIHIDKLPKDIKIIKISHCYKLC